MRCACLDVPTVRVRHLGELEGAVYSGSKRSSLAGNLTDFSDDKSWFWQWNFAIFLKFWCCRWIPRPHSHWNIGSVCLHKSSIPNWRYASSTYASLICPSFRWTWDMHLWVLQPWYAYYLGGFEVLSFSTLRCISGTGLDRYELMPPMLLETTPKVSVSGNPCENRNHIRNPSLDGKPVYRELVSVFALCFLQVYGLWEATNRKGPSSSFYYWIINQTVSISLCMWLVHQHVSEIGVRITSSIMRTRLTSLKA